VGRYRFLGDVALADCAVEIEETDASDLFETAARALAEVMVDPATVANDVRRTITLAAPRLDLLLYDSLSELST
jgi:SHS2 domain-containing protein